MTGVKHGAPESVPSCRLPPRLAVLAAGGGTGAGAPATEVARRLEHRGVEVVELVAASSRSGSGPDPFRIRDRVPDLAGEAVMVVAARRWGARRVMPAAAVEGRAIALLQADRTDELPEEPWPGSSATHVGAPWIVAAMAKEVFLAPSARWLAILRSGGRKVSDLRADRARRDDLLLGIAAGPGVLLYAGHGRTRGWGGYQSLRWDHVEPHRRHHSRPAGLVIAFACDTLKRMRSGDPFGSRMVSAGVARAYLGAAGPIRTVDAERLGDLVVALLASRGLTTVAELVAATDRAVLDDPAAARAWSRFRLLGDPAAPLH